MLAAKTERVAVVLPARDVAATIGPILDVLVVLAGDGWIDELVVVTRGDDPTAAIARARDVTLVDESLPRDGVGGSIGKGDAIWRGLASVDADIAVFLDTDTENFGPHFLIGILAPLLLDREVSFVKGTFRRPLRLDGKTIEGEGGRVSELVARPLVNLFFPELAGFTQPLAGEVALRRELWTRMHIPVGYGVEIGMLIDAWKIAGLDALAQVDLGRRQDASKPLRELIPMAHAVAAAALRRVPEGVEPRSLRLLVPRFEDLAEIRVSVEERPPLAGVR